MAKSFTLQTISDALGGQLTGDASIEITRVVHPADASGPRDLVLAVDKKLLPLLGERRPRALLVAGDARIAPDFADGTIVIDRPRFAMAKLTALFSEAVAVPRGIHPTAIIEPGAEIGEDVAIGAQVFVGTGAKIGQGSVLHPQVYIGPDVVLGEGALIYPGVRIGARVVIGARVIVHFNASIGSDGFSFVTPEPGSVETVKATGAVTATNTQLVRIASLGTVVIGDEVEIGANSSIDRGTIAATRIGNGTKIDNQVQVGHNVVIGANCIICGRTGIAGSATIGDRVVLGGGAGVADHVTVGDDVVAMALSGIGSNVPPRTLIGGIPALPRERAVENYQNVARLKGFFAKIEALTARLDALDAKGKSG